MPTRRAGLHALRVVARKFDEAVCQGQFVHFEASRLDLNGLRRLSAGASIGCRDARFEDSPSLSQEPIEPLADAGRCPRSTVVRS